MFILRKVISRVFFPVPLSLELLLVGLILLWLTRRQRLGKILVTGGTLSLLIFSNYTISTWLLRPLERTYAPFSTSPQCSTSECKVQYIAVLGGLGDNDPHVPVTSHVYPDLMVRLIEAVRLQREIPGSKLILSGGHMSSGGMAQVAESLGVKKDDIHELGQPPDTEAEAHEIAPIVGSNSFILVTSASHMRRAMGLFRARNLNPIAAPTDFLAPERSVEIDDYFPDAFKLFKSQIALYEYLGFAWAKLSGKL